PSGAVQVCTGFSFRPVYRHREKERAACADFAVRPDSSALRFDDAFHNEEAQTGPLPRRTRYLPKTIKDVHEVVLRNSPARVFNRKLDIISGLRGTYRNGRTRRRKLDCIVDQVCK